MTSDKNCSIWIAMSQILYSCNLVIWWLWIEQKPILEQSNNDMITLYTAKQICSVIVHSTAKFTINSILSVIKGQQLLSPSIEYCYLTLNLLNLESEPIAGYPQVSCTFAVQVTLQLVDTHYFLILCNERHFKSLT